MLVLRYFVVMEKTVFDRNIVFLPNLSNFRFYRVPISVLIHRLFSDQKGLYFLYFFRVYLRPLLTDVPFIGNVTVSFFQAPNIDFDLGGIANALDLPGINLVLRHVIQDQLEQTIVMPNFISVPLAAEEVCVKASLANKREGGSINPPMPSGVLSIHILEAKDLVNKDVKLLGQGKSDPYVKLRVIADGVAHNFKSDVIPNNLHPVWRLLIDLPVDNPDSLDDLQFEIYDEDTGNKDDFLGRCTVSVQAVRTAMTSGKVQDVWRKLEDVKKGSFHAEIGWCDLKLSRPEVKDDLHKGVVTVFVDSAANLLGGQTGLKLPNPSVKIELCGIVQATEQVVGTVNPVYQHRMSFLVRDPASDTLKLSVVDEKRQANLGTLRINISDILDRNCLTWSRNAFVLQTRHKRLGHSDRTPQVTLSLSYRYIHR